MNRIKYVPIQFWFRRDIRFFKKLRGEMQTAHRQVGIKNFVRLWLLLKEQSGEILLYVNTSIMGENVSSIKSGGSQSLKFWLHSVRMIESRRIETEFENPPAC